MNAQGILFDEWTGDDTLLLIDYFKMKKADRLDLKTVFADLKLDTCLGIEDISQGFDLFYSFPFPDGRASDYDFDMAIDVVIDLCIIVLENFRAGVVDTQKLDKYDREPFTFRLDVGKEELDALLKELKAFIDKPETYDLADFMDEEELKAYASDCREVYDALCGY